MDAAYKYGEQVPQPKQIIAGFSPVSFDLRYVRIPLIGDELTSTGTSKVVAESEVKFRHIAASGCALTLPRNNIVHALPAVLLQLSLRSYYLSLLGTIAAVTTKGYST